MEGSIKGASERLHVSQPTVSDQIKLLEEFFRCSLFERRNRALFLNKEGEMALAYAKEIFSTSRELTRRLRHREKPAKESLDIGLTPFISQYFLYEWLLPLFETPDLRVRFHEGDPHHLIADIEEEELDMAFLNNPEGLGKNLVSHKVGTNRTFAIAHKKFKKSKRPFPQSLNEIPFFGHSQGSFLRYDIDMFFARNGVLPQIIGEGDDLDLFELITSKGLGFTVVSEVGKNRICRDKNIVVLGELEELQSSVWAITRKDSESMGYQALSKLKI